MGKRILPPFAAALLSGMLFSYSHSFLFFIAGMTLAGGYYLCFYVKYREKRTGIVLMLLGTFLFGTLRMQGALDAGVRAEGYKEGDTITLTGKVWKKEKKNGWTLLYISGGSTGIAEGGTVGEVLCYVEEAEARGGEVDGQAGRAVSGASGRSEQAVSWDSGQSGQMVSRASGASNRTMSGAFDAFPIGAEVRVTGKVLAIHTAQNEGAFDEKSYLRSQGIFLKISGQELSVLRVPRFALRERLYQLREDMQSRYEAILYGEEAGLLSTMALGERSELATDVKTLFSEAGLSHILAISGLHVTLVGMAVYRLLRRVRFSLTGAALCSGGIVWLYGLMTQMSVPTSRAVGMFFCMLLAEVLGRGYDTLSALSLLAIIILCANPLTAMSVSFVFSFGAVLGVVLVGQPLANMYLTGCRIRWEQTHKMTNGRRFRKRIPQRIVSAVLASFGIQLATIPLVAWNFYAIPVYVMFLNILLLPCMGVLLSFALLGGLGLPGAKALLYVCHLLLFYYEAAADLSLRFPFAKWVIGKPDIWQVVVYYAVLAGFLWIVSDHVKRLERRHRRWLRQGGSAGVKRMEMGVSAEPTRGRADGIIGMSRREMGGSVDVVSWKAGGSVGVVSREAGWNAGCVFHWLYGLALVSVCLFFLIGYHGRRDFAVEMLSVGQGDGIYIESGCGEHFFIDGGSSSEEELGRYTLQPFLFAKGIAKIDRWFITHMDLDHYSGFQWLLENDYWVKTVVFAEGIEKTEAFYELLTLCEEKGVAVEYMRPGDAVVCGAKGKTRAKERAVAMGSVGANGSAGTNGSIGVNGSVGANGSTGAKESAEGLLTLTCLSPQAPSAYSGTNENSLVLLLEEGQDASLKMVFTGDIGEEQERAIIQTELFQQKIVERAPSDIVILKSAHHGSNNSNCSEWLSALSPDLVLISAGKNNRYHHPGKEAVARMDEQGVERLCTIECGQISLRWEGERVVVERYLKE